MGGFFGPTSVTISSSSTSGIGASLAFASPNGVIDPTITGFTHSTGRLEITLSGNTSWQGLPAGADVQQLFGTIISGNFQLTLLAQNGSTAQKQILASGDFVYSLNDTFQLFYDTGLNQWVLVP